MPCRQQWKKRPSVFIGKAFCRSFLSIGPRPLLSWLEFFQLKRSLFYGINFFSPSLWNYRADPLKAGRGTLDSRKHRVQRRCPYRGKILRENQTKINTDFTFYNFIPMEFSSRNDYKKKISKMRFIRKIGVALKPDRKQKYYKRRKLCRSFVYSV